MNPEIQPKTTPLRVIKDDKELYNCYRDSLRERSKVAISIHGGTDEHRAQIENALQEMLTTEVIKLAHDDLRARGVSDDFLDERGLRSSLEGVRLPQRDRTILESKVRVLARRMMIRQDDTEGGWDPGEGGKTKPSHPSAPSGTIEQQVDGPGGPMCLCVVGNMPGTTISLSGIPTTFPAGQNSLTIGVPLQIQNFWGTVPSGDFLKLVLEPGAAFSLDADQMLVGLASDVGWAKKVYAYNFCLGELSSVFQAGPNPVPNFMLLMKGCGGADTIVFAKPQAFGIWADVSNLEPSQFWSVLGGKRLTFTWVGDPNWFTGWGP
jgi:hypothetical protein